MAIRTVVNQDNWNAMKSGNSLTNQYDGALGFGMIRIYPNIDKWSFGRQPDAVRAISYVVTGIMQNDFAYSLSSEWSTMETPFDSGLGNIVGGIGTAAGGGEMGAVFTSKKYWKKSGYLDINPTVRFIDTNGDGLPLRVAEMLLKWATATGLGATGDLAQRFQQTITQKASELHATATETVITNMMDTDNPDDMLVTARSIMGELIQTGTNAVANTSEDLWDLAALRQSPPPLIVEVGKIFKHKDMVLTNVDFTFSREVTDKGPMYIDATLSLSTRKRISTTADVGLKAVADGISVNIMTSDGQLIDSNNPSTSPPV